MRKVTTASLWVLALWLLPGVASAQGYVIVGVATDGNKAVATRVSDSIRTQLEDAGAQMGPQVRFSELLAQAGGAQRCDEACLQGLAGRLEGRLLAVFTSQGGGWTAARVHEIRADGSQVLAAFLAPDEKLAEAASALAGKLLGNDGTLQITGGPQGNLLYVDGREVGPLPLDQSLTLSSGPHVVRVDDGKGAGRMARVRVLPRVSTKVDLDVLMGLKQAPTPIAGKSLLRSPWFWGAVGAVLIGGGSFALTDGYGTLAPDTKTVVVEIP